VTTYSESALRPPEAELHRRLGRQNPLDSEPGLQLVRRDRRVEAVTTRCGSWQ